MTRYGVGFAVAWLAVFATVGSPLEFSPLAYVLLGIAIAGLGMAHTRVLEARRADAS